MILQILQQFLFLFTIFILSLSSCNTNNSILLEEDLQPTSELTINDVTEFSIDDDDDDDYDDDDYDDDDYDDDDYDDDDYDNDDYDDDESYDIEFSIEELPDSVDVGDILHLIAQMINHGPNSYIGNLQLTYTVLEIFEEGDEYPINSSYGSFWEGDFNDNLFDVDEVIDLEDNQNLVVTEENFRRGQKNIIIIWPVDLISDTNPSNNYYIKEIYVRK